MELSDTERAIIETCALYAIYQELEDKGVVEGNLLERYLGGLSDYQRNVVVHFEGTRGEILNSMSQQLTDG
ncbi:hypothetical protein D3OALGA1CA_933 [Olavius algarvensis associated proteobacterium Delta 3]|nr:hypothetical protein D3OALGA1CA_933 [Olavius algarvensis associated proteobacterium Delta 3]CAB5129466.1 hypothetical protein D3OALGB2SA_3520 [Olavius algarvensis associated proteobacterium Delta 3]